MDRQVYKCECGYVTHFEKALEAHCRFKHHHPAKETEPETILPEIEKELTKAVKRQAKAKKEENTAETLVVTKKATTRKPRAKKTAAKES